MYKVILPNVSSLPANNRIKELYSKFEKLLKLEFEVYTIPPYDNEKLREEYLYSVDRLISKCDAFFGYDRNFMILRKIKNYKVPIILPLFADMTQGGMTLWINRNRFNCNDVLLFTSISDFNIYKKICPYCEIQTNFMQLPIDYCFQKSKTFHHKTDNKITLLYVGRFFKPKNIHLIIELCHRMKNNIDFELLLVGDWYYYGGGEEYKNIIINMIKKYDLESQVTFYGFLNGEALKNIYYEADIFINLSTNEDENFGLVQVEALSQGLPIVCSDWGGLKDHVRHGWNGYRVKTKYINKEIKIDLDEVMNYILKFKDHQLRSEMSVNSRNSFLELYTSDIILEKLKILIVDAIHNNNDSAKMEFTNEAYQYCLQKVYTSIKYSSIVNDSIYLKEYASTKGVEKYDMS